MNNSKVLGRIDTSKKMWKAILKMKVRIIGNNPRHPEIISLMLERMTEGKNWKQNYMMRK